MIGWGKIERFLSCRGKLIFWYIKLLGKRSSYIITIFFISRFWTNEESQNKNSFSSMKDCKSTKLFKHAHQILIIIEKYK